MIWQIQPGYSNLLMDFLSFLAVHCARFTCASSWSWFFSGICCSSDITIDAAPHRAASADLGRSGVALRACHVWRWILDTVSLDTQNTCSITAALQSHRCFRQIHKQRNNPDMFQADFQNDLERICVVYTWIIPDIDLKRLGKNMSGIYTRFRKWVDIFQVCIEIFQTYRVSGHIYGILQEYPTSTDSRWWFQ